MIDIDRTVATPVVRYNAVKSSSGPGGAVVSGIGQVGPLLDAGATEQTNALKAIHLAAADAGIPLNEIDGVVRFGLDTSLSEGFLASSLGGDGLTFVAETGTGGGNAAWLVGMAALAIENGLANNVICYRSVTWGSGRGREDKWLGDLPGTGTGARSFLRPFGWTNDLFAMLGQRYLAEYGRTAADLWQSVASTRAHAALNPRALRQEQFTLDEYLAMPYWMDPFREADRLLEIDGAVAILVSRRDRVRDTERGGGVPILAAAQHSGRRPSMSWESWIFNLDLDQRPGKLVADAIFPAAGIKPSDVTSAQFYDCYSIVPMLLLEEYGFCEPGTAADLIATGITRPGGAMPMNTHGGNLCEGYLHGVGHVVEAIRQARGESTSQAASRDYSLAVGASPSPNSAVLFGPQED